MLPHNFPDDMLFLMRASFAAIACYILAALALMFVPKGYRWILGASIALGFAVSTVLLSVLFIYARLPQ